MSQQKAFQQLVSELRKVLPYVRLKVPASHISIQQQVNHLAQAQTKLKVMQERMFFLSRQQRNPSNHRAYQILIGVVKELNQDVKDLTLLAEEYPIDPEGTISCLQSRKKKEAYLMRQIDSLKALELNRRNSNTSPALVIEKIAE